MTLLPIELILKVSRGSGFSMVFALLVAAFIWNLATWWRGLPASSSHTMIGSILGVLVFTTITNIFILNNLATEVQNIAKGLIIVGAVLLQRRAGRESSP